ncbi:hypothetical protein BJ170DRAFT_681713 [Xylariales sp. AK1849]|nr:hypothetical protein BJ170DRAFT_681713 [Xylariales sp. AK1849]
MNDPSAYRQVQATDSFQPTTQLAASGRPVQASDPGMAGMSEDIPNELNANLFISEIPAHTTEHEFLARVRGYGRVYSILMLQPRPGAPHNACNLSFFELEASRRFLHDAETKGFYIKGKRPGSRCIIVEGRPDKVNEEWLLAFLQSKLSFSLDEVRHRHLSTYRNKNEVRFGGYCRQSSSAYKALKHNKEIESVTFSPDPCQEDIP